MNLNQTRTHCKSIFQQGGRGERSIDWTSRRSKNLLEGDARSETEAVLSDSSSTAALIPLPRQRSGFKTYVTPQRPSSNHPLLATRNSDSATSHINNLCLTPLTTTPNFLAISIGMVIMFFEVTVVVIEKK